MLSSNLGLVTAEVQGMNRYLCYCSLSSFFFSDLAIGNKYCLTNLFIPPSGKLETLITTINIKL